MMQNPHKHLFEIFDFLIDVDDEVDDHLSSNVIDSMVSHCNGRGTVVRESVVGTTDEHRPFSKDLCWKKNSKNFEQTELYFT